MRTKYVLVSQCNSDWIFIGTTAAQQDPMNPDGLLLPPYATDVQRPEYDEKTQSLRFNLTDKEWKIIPIEESKPKEPEEPLPKQEIKKKSVEELLNTKPQVGPFQKAIIIDQDWRVIPDYLGVKYWMPDGTVNVMSVTGLNLPEGASLEPIPVTDLTLAKSKRILELKELYHKMIEQSIEFDSKVYPADSDKLLIISSELSKVDQDDYFVADVNGELIKLDKATLHLLFRAITTRNINLKSKLNNAISRLENTNSVTDVEAINL